MAEHILVTGGSGFIGQWLVQELNDRGYKTSTVDRNYSDVANSYHFPGDLLEPNYFKDVLATAKPDRVIHLAAQVGRLFGEDDVRHTVRSNAEMTTIVAKACGEQGVPLAYTSTSEVYGDRGEEICRESDALTCLPHNLYGVSKRWGEDACNLYAPEGLYIFRPSMPYGPGAPPGRGRRALDNMLWQAHHRMPITVHRGSKRSWCWAGDTVIAMRLAIEKGEPGVYNIGRDDDYKTMLEIAQRSCRIAGAELDLIEEVDPPVQQTVVKRLSTHKIRDLGWRPTVELIEGMYAVYDHVKDYDKEGVLA